METLNVGMKVYEEIAEEVKKKGNAVVPGDLLGRVYRRNRTEADLRPSARRSSRHPDEDIRLERSAYSVASAYHERAREQHAAGANDGCNAAAATGPGQEEEGVLRENRRFL